MVELVDVIIKSICPVSLISEIEEMDINPEDENAQ